MLQAGIVRPSTSSFSSSILLVKKKKVDDSLWITRHPTTYNLELIPIPKIGLDDCVDYKVPNNIKTTNFLDEPLDDFMVLNFSLSLICVKVTIK